MSKQSNHSIMIGTVFVAFCVLIGLSLFWFNNEKSRPNPNIESAETMIELENEGEIGNQPVLEEQPLGTEFEEERRSDYLEAHSNMAESLNAAAAALTDSGIEVGLTYSEAMKRLATVGTLPRSKQDMIDSDHRCVSEEPTEDIGCLDHQNLEGCFYKPAVKSDEALPYECRFVFDNDTGGVITVDTTGVEQDSKVTDFMFHAGY